jgi:hypothetical protein
VEALKRLSDIWAQTRGDGKSSSKPDPEVASQHALATFCHAVMNSASFLYVD